MSVEELMRRASELLDSGTLTKPDESFVSHAVTTFDRGQRLDAGTVSRLRDIIDINS